MDNDIATHWHSVFATENGQVSTHDNPPYHLIVTLPEAVETSGIVTTPRPESVNGQFFVGDIYVSDSDDGEWVLLSEGYEFVTERGKQTDIVFTKNIKVKRVWIEVLVTHGGFGCLAEFDLMVKKDKLDTIGLDEVVPGEFIYQLYSVSTENATAECSAPFWVGGAEKVIDGNSTNWCQTEAIPDGDWPVVFSIDLNHEYTIKEMRIAPRGSEDCHGQWLKVSVYASVDNNDWFPLVEHKEYPEDTSSRIITLDEETKVRYVEFQIEEAVAKRVSCAEITFWQSGAAKKNDEKGSAETYVLKIGSNVIETTKNGEKTEKEIDTAPVIVNGSTLIPLRGLLEEMGSTVSWDGATETVTVENGKNTIKLNIWNRLVYVYGTQWGDLRYTLLNPPIIMNSRTMIPIRFVSEQLGYNVSWDGETKNVTIEK